MPWYAAQIKTQNANLKREIVMRRDRRKPDNGRLDWPFDAEPALFEYHDYSSIRQLIFFTSKSDASGHHLLLIPSEPSTIAWLSRCIIISTLSMIIIHLMPSTTDQIHSMSIVYRFVCKLCYFKIRFGMLSAGIRLEPGPREFIIPWCDTNKVGAGRLFFMKPGFWNNNIMSRTQTLHHNPKPWSS